MRSRCKGNVNPVPLRSAKAKHLLVLACRVRQPGLIQIEAARRHTPGRRVNAFAVTDLKMIVRANEIDTLILMGVATSGVVLSTLLHASDQDYRLLVVKDCCTDLEAGVHHCLVEKCFPPTPLSQ